MKWQKKWGVLLFLIGAINIIPLAVMWAAGNFVMWLYLSSVSALGFCWAFGIALACSEVKW